MRTIDEVNQDILNTCSKIGQIEVQKTKLIYQADTMLAPLHQRVSELMAESDQIKTVQEELAKQTEANKVTTAPPVAS
jgi:hypothetical protein